MSAGAWPIVGVAAVCCVAAPLGVRLVQQAARPPTPAPPLSSAPVAAPPAVRPAPRYAAPPSPAPMWGGVEIPANAMGQYETDVRIDGATVPMLIDTGATLVALTETDARRLGLYLADSDFRHAAHTANGVTAIAIVTLREVELGPIRVRDVRASVHRGAGLGKSLLGMSFLGRVSKVEVASGRLIIRQ